MSALQHLGGGIAGQNVDQMARAEIFAGPQNGRQSLAHGVGGVEHQGGTGAQIAIAARLGRLVEIAQQHLTAAARRLGQTQKRIQPGVISLLAVKRRRPLVNLRAAQANVVGAIQRHRLGRQAVTPGAANLLVIAFDRLRQIGMGDPADIGLVDAHAKGNRRHHDQPVLLLKAHFDQPPRLGVHAGVVIARRMARLTQGLGQHLGLGPRAAIDDARLAPAGSGKAEDLVARLVLDGKGQVDVGPVKAAQKGRGLFAVEQAGDNLGPGFLIRRGGKGGQRHAKCAAQVADPQVIGAEIMAPLADAMRLIHRDQIDIDPAQQGHGARRRQPLRRDVQQFQPPIVQRLKDILGFLIGIARGQRPRLDPHRLQRAHLIAHQGNQRRDDDGHPVTTQGRQLKTQRFPAARRHDGQCVAPRHHGIDDLFLTRTVIRETKDRVQKGPGVAHVFINLHPSASGPAVVKALLEVVDDHNAQRDDGEQHDQRGQVDAAGDRDQLAKAGIQRLQQALQGRPDLLDQRLAQVQDLKVDQPGHDDMGQHDPAGNV